MGDPKGVATHLATLLQSPAVLMAIRAALALFLVGTQPANIGEGVARNRSRCKGRKGDGAGPYPPRPLNPRAADLDRVWGLGSRPNFANKPEEGSKEVHTQLQPSVPTPLPSSNTHLRTPITS